MNKEGFEQALREKLQKIPKETRNRWSDSDLLVWWNKARVEDSYLTWKHCPGDIWQWIPGMCRNLIGQDAIV